MNWNISPFRACYTSFKVVLISWCFEQLIFRLIWRVDSRDVCYLGTHYFSYTIFPDRDRDLIYTVYPKKYAHGYCFAVLCCGYTLTDFPISIRLTSLALWQSNDCPSASKATLMNMDKYFMWIHYERLHNHNKAKHNKRIWLNMSSICDVINKTKHNKTMCIFMGIQCGFTA